MKHEAVFPKLRYKQSASIPRYSYIRHHSSRSLLHVLPNIELRVYHHSQVFDGHLGNDDMISNSNVSIISHTMIVGEDRFCLLLRKL